MTAIPRPITIDDVELYRRYDGDLDGYVRQGRPGDLPDAAWYAIDGLRRRLALVADGLVSAAFERELNDDFDAWTSDDAARRALRALIDAGSSA